MTSSELVEQKQIFISVPTSRRASGVHACAASTLIPILRKFASKKNTKIYKFCVYN